VEEEIKQMRDEKEKKKERRAGSPTSSGSIRKLSRQQ
jgi:hypothetical protein